MKLLAHSVSWSFLHKVPGFTLRDRVRILDIQKVLGVEILLFHLERRHLSWIGHQNRIPLDILLLKVFWVWRHTGDDPEPTVCNYISHSVQDCPGKLGETWITRSDRWTSELPGWHPDLHLDTRRTNVTVVQREDGIYSTCKKMHTDIYTDRWSLDIQGKPVALFCQGQCLYDVTSQVHITHGKSLWLAVGCSSDDSIRFCCHSSQSTEMSIIPLPSDRWPVQYTPFLLYICTALLYPPFAVILSVCLSLTIHLQASTFTSFYSLYHFFACSHLSSDFFSTCLFCISLSTTILSFSPVFHLFKTVFTPSLQTFPPFCHHYMWRQSHSAVPACLSFRHLSLHFFLVFWKHSGAFQPVEGHLLADLTWL